VRLLPVVSLIATTVMAAPAGAVTVAVAPVRDDQAAEGDALRKQVEHGLADNGVTVVSFPALVQAASAQGFSPADLARPAVLIPVAKAAGAEAVLTGSVQREGRGETLDIRVFNLDGVELWSRPIPMKKGKLDKDIPRKIAKAVVAAIANGPPAGSTPTAGTAETPPATPDEGAAKPDMTPKPEEGEAKPEEAKPEEAKPEEAKPEEAPKPRKPVASSEEATPSKPVKKGPKKKATTSEEEEIDGPPQEAKPDTQPAPPYIDLGAGLSITFRNYKVCPGVTSCSQPGPTPVNGKDVPITYSTGAPYGGFDLQGEIFPFPKLLPINEQLTFTLGVGGEFGQSLTLSNAYRDPVSNNPASFNSYEQRAEGALLARIYYGVLGGYGNTGLFGGFEMHKFIVGANDVITESARVGFGVGLNSELPLAGDFFKATVRFTYMPAMNPGVPETTEYGQTGAGSGWDFRGGFTGGFGYVGYSALVAYTSFSDVYTGPGAVTTNGAVAQESYLTIYILAHGRF
jgi:hypothetical protein